MSSRTQPSRDQRPHALQQIRNRVVGRNRLQPARHELQRHEEWRQEHDREEDHEAGVDRCRVARFEGYRVRKTVVDQRPDGADQQVHDDAHGTARELDTDDERKDKHGDGHRYGESHISNHEPHQHRQAVDRRERKAIEIAPLYVQHQDVRPAEARNREQRRHRNLERLVIEAPGYVLRQILQRSHVDHEEEHRNDQRRDHRLDVARNRPQRAAAQVQNVPEEASSPRSDASAGLRNGINRLCNGVQDAASSCACAAAVP